MSTIAEDIVKISMTDAGAGVSVSDQKTILLLAGGTKPTAYGTAVTKSYSDYSEVGKDWGTTSKIYYLAQSGFSQSQYPSTVTIASYGATASAETVEAALASAVSEGAEFYNVVCDFDDEAILADLGTYAASAKKIIYCDSDDALILDSTSSADVLSLLKTAGITRVAVYYNSTATQGVCAAELFARCGLDPVRGTFAHKALTGITYENVTVAQYTAATAKGANLYVKISASDSRVVFGTLCDGDYIDRIFKIDWVEFNIRAELLDLLKTANDGYGIDYDDAGFEASSGVVNQVLALGADDDHHYLMSEFSVTTVPYSKLTTAEKTAREYDHIKFTFVPMGSIHKFNPVSGYITK